MVIFCFLLLISLYFVKKRNIDDYLNEVIFHNGKLSFSKSWTFGLKGIMALLIIMHHVATHVNEWYGSEFFWQCRVLRDFGPWGEMIVGVFFFVSGYGMMISFLTKKNEYIKIFIKKRFLKLLPPFLFLGLLNQVLLSIRTGDWDIWGRFVDFVLWGKFFFLWFVTMLIWFYLAFYLSFKYIKNIKYGMFSVLLIVVLLSLYVGLRGYGEWWWKSNLCLPIGIYYAFYEEKISGWLLIKFKLKLSVTILVLFILALITKTTPAYFISLKLITLLLPIFIVWFSYIVPFRSNGLISFLSTISYELFLVHIMFLDYIPMLHVFPLIGIFLLVFFTLPISYVCHCIFKSI